MTAYRGVLLDLFGTLIGVDLSRIPELEIDGARQRTTVAGLADVLAAWAPRISPRHFLGALSSVSEEMAQGRAADHVELPSRERFRRALRRAGCEEKVIAEAAVHLSRAHMQLIVRATVWPPAHAGVLRALRSRYRLGVVTNFDDTATVYDILVRHDIAPLLDTIVVSEAVGLRKPHPAVVRAGLRGLALDAGDVLFVGDTLAEDIAGARAAGLDAAWLDAAGRGLPDGAEPPRYVVRALPDLVEMLACP